MPSTHVQSQVARPGSLPPDLTPQQRQLVELMQRIRYGCIRVLAVRKGQPDFTQRIEWTRTVKILGENAPHPRLGQSFVPKQHVTELFRLLTELNEGVIHDLEVRDGLPFTYELHGLINP